MHAGRWLREAGLETATGKVLIGNEEIFPVVMRCDQLVLNGAPGSRGNEEVEPGRGMIVRWRD